MPIENTFISKLILCAIIKSVKSIPRVNHIDSLHMKWCTLKNMGNWPFSPGHTLSHKTNNILRTAADMTKIKTNIYRKHVKLSVITISNVLVEKGHLCNNFPTPLPQNSIIFHSMWHMILLMILQISEIYQSFLFSVQFLVLLITCNHHFMEILFYLTFSWTKPWKYVSNLFDKKRVSLVFIDSWKSDIAAFLELNPGISMTHRHPANRKTGSPFVPPGETKFWNWPLWPKDYISIWTSLSTSRGVYSYSNANWRHVCTQICPHGCPSAPGSKEVMHHEVSCSRV